MSHVEMPPCHAHQKGPGEKFFRAVWENPLEGDHHRTIKLSPDRGWGSQLSSPISTPLSQLPSTTQKSKDGEPNSSSGVWQRRERSTITRAADDTPLCSCIRSLLCSTSTAHRSRSLLTDSHTTSTNRSAHHAACSDTLTAREQRERATISTEWQRPPAVRRTHSLLLTALLTVVRSLLH